MPTCVYVMLVILVVPATSQCVSGNNPIILRFAQDLVHAWLQTCALALMVRLVVNVKLFRVMEKRILIRPFVLDMVHASN